MADYSPHLASHIRKEAAQLGFAATGFSSPVLQPLAMERYSAMIREQRHGEMSYMEKRMEERADPSLLLSGLRTLISAAICYKHPVSYRQGFPKISKYALVDDYHTVVRNKLEQLVEAIARLVDEPVAALIAVDSRPLLEKSWAEQAGIGKAGKNTLLNVPSAGSSVFLGEILINIEIRSTPVTLPDYCGSCTLCLEHCPTGALLKPGKIDASQCISFLTVELKREFTAKEATMIGDWLFGCDICQDVCPYNKQASRKADNDFRLRHELLNISTEEILNLTRSGFHKLFYGTPVFRIGLRRLKRNARAVAENLKRVENGIAP